MLLPLYNTPGQQNWKKKRIWQSWKKLLPILQYNANAALFLPF